MVLDGIGRLNNICLCGELYSCWALTENNKSLYTNYPSIKSILILKKRLSYLTLTFIGNQMGCRELKPLTWGSITTKWDYLHALLPNVLSFLGRSGEFAVWKLCLKQDAYTVWKDKQHSILLISLVSLETLDSYFHLFLLRDFILWTTNSEHHYSTKLFFLPFIVLLCYFL